MKKSILIFLALFIFGCSTQPPTETELFIYLDFTEGQDYSSRFEEDLASYMELMELSETGSPNYGKIRIYPLYDVGSSRGKTIKLKEGKSQMEGNKFLRQQDLDKFQARILDALNEINETHTGKALSNSHIFSPVCKGVKKLNNSEANRKIVVIYSDMLENSELANFHSKKDNFEKWSTAFDTSCDMGEVADLEFFIVHPVDKKNDKKIKIAEDFWAKFLMDKGLDEDGFHFDTGLER